MIDVSMSENEIKDYLAQPILARIATVDDGRMPNIHPMWFLYEDSRMFMTTPKTAVKIRNIKNNNSVAIAVDTGEEGNIKGVVFRGKQN